MLVLRAEEALQYVGQPSIPELSRSTVSQAGLLRFVGRLPGVLSPHTACWTSGAAETCGKYLFRTMEHVEKTGFYVTRSINIEGRVGVGELGQAGSGLHQAYLPSDHQALLRRPGACE